LYKNVAEQARVKRETGEDPGEIWQSAKEFAQTQVEHCDCPECTSRARRLGVEVPETKKTAQPDGGLYVSGRPVEDKTIYTPSGRELKVPPAAVLAARANVCGCSSCRRVAQNAETTEFFQSTYARFLQEQGVVA